MLQRSYGCSAEARSQTTTAADLSGTNVSGADMGREVSVKGTALRSRARWGWHSAR